MEQQNSNPNTTPQDQQQGQQTPQPITLQVDYPLPNGDYATEVLGRMVNTIAMIDLVVDTKAARRKWGYTPLINILYDELGNGLAKAASTDKEAGDPERAAAAAAFDAIFENTNKTYKHSLYKYKEALQLLHDLPLKNKGLDQIIVLYYFTIQSITPMEISPLTDEQRAGLITTAQEMDQLYTNTDDLHKETIPVSYFINIPAEYTEAREFYSYMPFVSYYMDYKGLINLEDYTPAAPVYVDPTAKQKREPQQLPLPLLPAIEITKYVMINNTAMNDMTTMPLINGDPHDVYVFGNKSDITTYIAISCEPDPEIGVEIKLPRKLSAYKRTLTNAVISLFVAGKEKGQDKPLLSDEMINRAMPGAGEKLTRGKKAAMTKALNELRATHMTINATTEFRKRGIIGPNDTWERDGYFFSLTRDTVRVQNGRTVHAYQIDRKPLMYEYAQLTNQLLTVPAKCLDIRRVKDGQITDKAVGMNEDRQALTDILLRRIALMKQDAHNKKQKQSHTILFSTLFETADLANLSRDREMDYRKFIFDVLDYQTAIGYIKGYKKQTKGRAITGIEIRL